MSTIAFFLRLGRWGIAGFSAIAFISTFVQALAFYQIAGHNAASQATFGASISALATHFTAVFPPPVRPDTVGGYVEWRGFHAIALLFAIWALASATAMVRADEERGVIEASLAAGVSRAQLLVARTVSFAVGLTIASAAAALGFVAGVRAGGDSLEPSGVIQASLLLVLLALSYYALAMLVAQLFAARNATAVAGIALLSLFLINSLSRTFTSLSTVRWLSPFRYYDLNQPLSPGGTFDTRSAVMLLAISLVATGIAAEAFARRDLGSPLLPVRMWRLAPSNEPSRALWWRVAVVRELYLRRIGLLTWSAGMLILAIVFASVTKSAIQPLLSIPSLLPYFSAIVRGNIYPAVLGFTWFNFAELLFAAFAISQVARWSGEDTDVRLEALLSQPRSRAGVVVERMAVLVMGAALVAAVSGAAVFYGSRSQGIDLDAQRVAIASLMLVPFAAVFAGAGALLAAWNPRAAVGLLGGLAFLSYLDTEAGPLLKWPAWIQDLSAFKLFGTPLVTGLDTRNLAILLLLALAGLGSSILAIQRRDIGA